MREITEKMIAEARRMRASGISYRQIAQAFGVGQLRIMRALDPIFAANQREAQALRNRAARREIREASEAARWAIGQSSGPAPDDDIVDRQRAWQRVPDTRSLTGLLLGDPHPGRRAAMEKVA